MQNGNKCTVNLGGQIRKLSFSFETWLAVLQDSEKKGITFDELTKKYKLFMVTFTYHAIKELDDFIPQDLPQDFDILTVKEWIENMDLQEQIDLTNAISEGVQISTKKISGMTEIVQENKKNIKKKTSRQRK
jgi:hypothetical protein